MKNMFQQLIAMSPIFILIITLLILLLSISWKRNHFFNFLITIIGLKIALISLFFIEIHVNLNITELLRIDSYSIFYTGLLILSSIIVCIFAYNWLSNFSENKEEFYLLVLIATIGGIILTNAIHLSSLFIGLELVSLPLSGLIGYSIRIQKYALESAIKYTILSAIASSFILFGIALIYSNTGTLSFMQIECFLKKLINIDPIILIGFGMIIIGISFKLSLAPFHFWTADVYQGSPLPATTFLATTSKIAVFSAIMRFFVYIPITKNESIHVLLYVISIMSILIGNLMAISQNNIKRILGYSSIANLGYLLVTLITLQQNNYFSLETANIYIISYLLSNIGIFGIMNLISKPHKQLDSEDSDSIYNYRGLFWHRPVISSLMTIMILSLAGIPITVGFIGKFYIINTNINSNLWYLLFTVIAGSTISLYYYLRIVINLYLHQPKFYFYDTTKYWVYTANGIIVIIITILILLLGVYPQPMIELARIAHL